MKPRNTKQKAILEEELLKIKTFFTADELLDRSNARGAGIGIATVYRFLKEQAALHKLHSYACNRRQVYSSQKSTHAHFTCTKCGKIEHLSISEIDSIGKAVRGKICHFQVDVSGICAKCESKL